MKQICTTMHTCWWTYTKTQIPFHKHRLWNDRFGLHWQHLLHRPRVYVNHLQMYVCVLNIHVKTLWYITMITLLTKIQNISFNRISKHKSLIKSINETISFSTEFYLNVVSNSNATDGHLYLATSVYFCVSLPLVINLYHCFRFSVWFETKFYREFIYGSSHKAAQSNPNEISLV